MDDAWPFVGLERGAYGLILADPPWRFRTWGDHGQTKSPSKHYSLMTMEQLYALPVGDLAARDCALVVWGVAPMVPHAIDLIKAWGFTFKTSGVWAKQSKTGRIWAFGTGYVWRSASEPYFYATRGEPKSAVKDIRNLIVSPLREHSRKPERMRKDLDRMFPDVRKVELFARQPAPGWDAWGNQTEKFQAATPLLDAAEMRVRQDDLLIEAGL